DAAGRRHVAYQKTTDPATTPKYELRYATDAAGKWTTQKLSTPAAPADGRGNSVAMDGAGHSHVASAGEAGTYHFTDASGAFVADLVSTSALAGPSISVRGVVVAVFGEASGQMRYAQGPAP